MSENTNKIQFENKVKWSFKELLKSILYFILISIIIIILLIINTFISTIDNKMISMLGFSMLIGLLLLWGYIPLKTPLNVKKLPLVSKEKALFYYALFIGFLALSFNLFFDYNFQEHMDKKLELEVFYPFFSIIASILFFIISYSRYYRNDNGELKEDRDIANDFLLSLSAALIVGIIATTLGDKFKFDFKHLCSFNMFLSFLFIFVSLVIVKSNIKYAKKKKEGDNQ